MVDDEIKSAYEIAMEKLAAMDEPTEAERLGWKYMPEGRKLAAAFLNGKGDLKTKLDAYRDDAREHVARGIAEILLSNLFLPRTEPEQAQAARVLAGLKELKAKRAAELCGRLEQLFAHYREQGAAQLEQSYQQLKAEMEAKLRQVLSQQAGMAVTGNIDVESQPEFQAEWRRVRGQLEEQYRKLLEEYREEYRQLP